MLSVIVNFNSCRCSCECEQAAGCRTMIARDINSGNILAVKMYCSAVNINTDKAVADSIRAFHDQYSNTTSFVESSDSIYRRYRVTNLKCDETDFYTQQDFDCECAK